MKESSLFAPNVLRAQITCSNDRPCAYFADPIGGSKMAFVKGPYPSEAKAGVAVLVSTIKSACCPELPNVAPGIIFLEPDLWTDLKDVAVGFRRKADRGKKHAFLVFDSLMGEDVSELPVTLASSSRLLDIFLWVDPTIIFRTQIKGFK